MTDHHEEDDLAPTQTAGYKVGEKKSLQEYETLDANDESLKKWKASLGLGKSAGKFTLLLQPPYPIFFFFFTIHSASAFH
jgi:RHO protein GDP dissociation inhibitor